FRFGHYVSRFVPVSLSPFRPCGRRYHDCKSGGYAERCSLLDGSEESPSALLSPRRPRPQASPNLHSESPQNSLPEANLDFTALREAADRARRDSRFFHCKEVS